MIRRGLLEHFMPKALEGPPLDVVTIKNLIKEIGYLLESTEVQEEEKYNHWRKELKKQLGEEATNPKIMMAEDVGDDAIESD